MECPSCKTNCKWQNELWSSGSVHTRYICPNCGWRGIGPTMSGPATVDSTGEPLSSMPPTFQAHSSQKKEGCFIATVCYGSADCPEVILLRSFRDQVLMGQRLGRVLIQFYYSVSPVVAEWLAKRPTFSVLIRKQILTPLVVLAGLKKTTQPNKPNSADAKSRAAD